MNDYTDGKSQFECSTCQHIGSEDTLIDMSDEDQQLCPKCSNTVTVLLPPSNCVLEWVPREQNEESDSIGHGAYEQYLRDQKKKL